MKNRADEIRRRYRQRIESKGSSQSFRDSANSKQLPNFGQSDEVTNKFASGFIMRVLASICLFLLVGIFFKSQSPQLDSARSFITNSFENEFQFAKVSAWYEEQFGKPLALLPTNEETPVNSTSNDEELEVAYAIPAIGSKVTESFEDNGQGILLETGSNSDVVAVNTGYIRFIAERENLGKTVIIQHSDGSESWYGKLDSFDSDIKLYDVIEKGDPIGKVSKSENDSGLFYFAIKQGDSFVDPLKVVNFE